MRSLQCYKSRSFTLFALVLFLAAKQAVSQERTQPDAEAPAGMRSKPTVATPLSLKSVLASDYSGLLWDSTKADLSPVSSSKVLVWKELRELGLSSLFETHTDSPRNELQKLKDVAPDPELSVDLGLLKYNMAGTQSKVFDSIRTHLELVKGVPFASLGHMQELRQGVSLESTDTFENFAGRPLKDFCLSGIGKGLPTYTLTGSSILDLAIAEAARSNLELSLLHLMEQPDLFLQIEEFGFSSDESESVSETPWVELFDRLIERHEVSNRSIITQLENESRLANSEKAKHFFLNLKSQMNSAKQSCSKNKGRWIEGNGIKNQNKVTIYSCKSNLKNLSFDLSINIKNEDQKSLIFRIVKDEIGFELESTENEFGSFTSIRWDNPSKAASQRIYYFDNAGNPLAMRDPDTSEMFYGWDEFGHLVWSGQKDFNGKWLSDTTWSLNGKISSEFTFDDQGTVSRYSEWYKDGQLKRVKLFSHGVADSIETWWHQSGKKAGEAMWYAGKKFGTSKIYFENGQIQYDASYIDDKLDGPLNWYDELGSKVFSGNFKHGLASGLIKIMQGNLDLAIANFVDGTVEGPVSIGSSQNHQAILLFANGKLNGLSFFQDKSGVKRLSVPFLAGKLQGEFIGNSSSGTKVVSCTYRDGHLESWNTQCSTSSIKSEPCVLSGKVKNYRAGVSTSHFQSKDFLTKASCKSVDDIWTSCTWEIDRSKQTLNLNLLSSIIKNKTTGCKYNLMNWDLSDWLEKHKETVSIKAKPSARCLNKSDLKCQIDLKSGLKIKNCGFIKKPIAVAHDHE